MVLFRNMVFNSLRANVAIIDIREIRQEV